MQLFTPKIGQTFSLSASTTSAPQALNPAQIASSSWRIYNAGNVPVFVKWGSGTQTATTAAMPLAPGAVEVFGKLDSWDNVAVITASGTATVYFTPGEGI
jgi:hypothetical protein